jgi:hypothetical protein
MIYLVDANVLSEPTKQAADAELSRGSMQTNPA